MTDESNNNTSNIVPLWARIDAWAYREAKRRKAWTIFNAGPGPGVDFDDFLYFLKKCQMHIGAATALQRKHFSGLGTKNPTVLVQHADGTYTREMLHLRAAKIIIKYIGCEGDPEDRPFPGRYVFDKFIPWSRTATSHEEDESAA